MGIQPVVVHYDLPTWTIPKLTEDMQFLAARQQQPVPFIPISNVAEKARYKFIIKKLHNNSIPVRKPTTNFFKNMEYEWNTTIPLLNPEDIYRKHTFHLENYYNKTYEKARHVEATLGEDRLLLTEFIQDLAEPAPAGCNMIHPVLSESSSSVRQVQKPIRAIPLVQPAPIIPRPLLSRSIQQRWQPANAFSNSFAGCNALVPARMTQRVPVDAIFTEVQPTGDIDPKRSKRIRQCRTCLLYNPECTGAWNRKYCKEVRKK